jgi:uncharacterized protein YndB with AHSA1/START domain
MKKFLLSLGILCAIVLVTAALQSDEMKVSRSAVLNAPPEAVFKVVNDFRRWDEWSPWAKLDPAMTKSLEGPPEGEGAIYRWSGNSEVGEGLTRLVESRPNERIGMELEFVRPFAGSSAVQFTFEPAGEGARVTWSMQSRKPFIGKVIGLFMDCEKMCGDQFNEGLANLGRVVTTPSP